MTFASPSLKGSCSCCRLRTSASSSFCRGCRRVVCPGCAPIAGGDPRRAHQLTDHEGWKRHGGRRPATWGKKFRRGAGSIPSAPRRGTVVVNTHPAWHRLFKPTQTALLAAAVGAAKMLSADAVGGTD